MTCSCVAFNSRQRFLEFPVRLAQILLGLFASGQVFHRTRDDFVDRFGQLFGEEEANDKPAEKNAQAKADDLPAKCPILPDGSGQRVKANLIGRRDLCLGIKRLVIKKIRSACQFDEKVTGLLLVRDCGNAFGDNMPVQLVEIVDVETLIEPDAAADGVTTVQLPRP